MTDTPRHWLMKSEPGTYGIDDLRRDGVTTWEGVRNYQARNYLRDEVRVGDLVLFYHSSTKPTGVAGLARVVRGAYPDPTAFDPEHPYFDTKSDPDVPRWLMVDVAFVEQWHAVVSLATLKAESALDGLLVTRKGQRLSVMPVDPDHYAHIVRLGRASGTWTED
ncbi:MAG: EVE domain-containing protein [Myxococcota bacterium]